MNVFSYINPRSQRFYRRTKACNSIVEDPLSVTINVHYNLIIYKGNLHKLIYY